MRSDFVPVYKAKRRQKVKLNTRRGLLRHKRAIEAERAERAHMDAALHLVPGKWKKHEREMEANTRGISG